MTDLPTVSSHQLITIARASGHELRNALNSLVVNLEVVRSRISDADTLAFAEQAVKQSEESARMAEASITLLNLIASAIDHDGRFRGSVTGGSVRVDATEGEVERSVKALRGLVERGAVKVDTSGPTIILSIPETDALHNNE